jgi:hypothetical protein
MNGLYNIINGRIVLNLLIDQQRLHEFSVWVRQNKIPHTPTNRSDTWVFASEDVERVERWLDEHDIQKQ